MLARSVNRTAPGTAGCGTHSSTPSLAVRQPKASHGRGYPALEGATKHRHTRKLEQGKQEESSLRAPSHRRPASLRHGCRDWGAAAAARAPPRLRPYAALLLQAARPPHCSVRSACTSAARASSPRRRPAAQSAGVGPTLLRERTRPRQCAPWPARAHEGVRPRAEKLLLSRCVCRLCAATTSLQRFSRQSCTQVIAASKVVSQASTGVATSLHTIPTAPTAIAWDRTTGLVAGPAAAACAPTCTCSAALQARGVPQQLSSPYPAAAGDVATAAHHHAAAPSSQPTPDPAAAAALWAEELRHLQARRQHLAAEVADLLALRRQQQQHRHAPTSSVEEALFIDEGAEFCPTTCQVETAPEVRQARQALAQHIAALATRHAWAPAATTAHQHQQPPHAGAKQLQAQWEAAGLDVTHLLVSAKAVMCPSSCCCVCRLPSSPGPERGFCGPRACARRCAWRCCSSCRRSPSSGSRRATPRSRCSPSSATAWPSWRPRTRSSSSSSSFPRCPLPPPSLPVSCHLSRLSGRWTRRAPTSPPTATTGSERRAVVQPTFALLIPLPSAATHLPLPLALKSQAVERPTQTHCWLNGAPLMPFACSCPGPCCLWALFGMVLVLSACAVVSSSVRPRVHVVFLWCCPPRMARDARRWCGSMVRLTSLHPRGRGAEAP